MKILLIALGVVVLFWVISWIISSADKLEEEKAQEESNKPPWA